MLIRVFLGFLVPFLLAACGDYEKAQALFARAQQDRQKTDYIALRPLEGVFEGRVESDFSDPFMLAKDLQKTQKDLRNRAAALHDGAALHNVGGQDTNN